MSWGSALAVTRMIGMKGSDGFARSRRQTSNPSSLGIITSSRMRSGCVSCAAASASSPSAAVTMSYPLAARRICKMWTFVGVSSTIRIRGGVLTPSRPVAAARYSRILARSSRGAKGLVT